MCSLFCGYESTHLSVFVCACMQEEGASELWLKYENLTFGLSQILIEELRLILLPTKAAQLK